MKYAVFFKPAKDHRLNLSQLANFLLLFPGMKCITMLQLKSGRAITEQEKRICQCQPWLTDYHLAILSNEQSVCLF